MRKVASSIKFPSFLSKKVDGNRTLGENVCDSGGLAHAWTAYKSNSKAGGEEIRSQEYRLPGVNYTDDQLFFITYGQVSKLWLSLS